MTVVTIVASWIPTSTALHLTFRRSIGFGASIHLDEGQVVIEVPFCLMVTCNSDTCGHNIGARKKLKERTEHWMRKFGVDPPQ